jgi:hypothetical protein
MSLKLAVQEFKGKFLGWVREDQRPSKVSCQRQQQSSRNAYIIAFTKIREYIYEVPYFVLGFVAGTTGPIIFTLLLPILLLWTKLFHETLVLHVPLLWILYNCCTEKEKRISTCI